MAMKGQKEKGVVEKKNRRGGARRDPSLFLEQEDRADGKKEKGRTKGGGRKKGRCTFAQKKTQEGGSTSLKR